MKVLTLLGLVITSVFFVTTASGKTENCLKQHPDNVIVGQSASDNNITGGALGCAITTYKRRKAEREKGHHQQ